MIALNTVYLLDALELLRQLDDGSVDAIIADPPYNMTELDFEQAIDWSAFWVQARRVLRTPNHPTILFSQQPFTTDLIVSNRRGYRNEIIYEKTMPVGFLNANRRPLQCHENVLVFADGQPEYSPQMEAVTTEKKGSVKKHANGSNHYSNIERTTSYEWSGQRYPRSVWLFAQHKTFDRSDTDHPTQKPLALMERLILTYTQPDWLVVDPFAGSGSTLVACQQLARQFVGGDLSAEYVEMARRRLALPYTTAMFT